MSKLNLEFIIASPVENNIEAETDLIQLMIQISSIGLQDINISKNDAIMQERTENE